MSCTRTSGYPKVPAIDELRKEINSGFQQAGTYTPFPSSRIRGNDGAGFIKRKEDLFF